MIEINVADFIPKELRQQAQDALIDFVSNQAKKYVDDRVAEKIGKLRSDGAFRKQFDQGLERALKRFVEEYYEEDEDLVEAIVKDTSLFRNHEVKQALMIMIKRPGSYLLDEREIVEQSFDTVLPTRKRRGRVNRAMFYLMRCLVEELWHAPELQPIYSLQFQKITAESVRQQTELQKAQLQAITTLNDGVKQALLQLTDAIADRKLLLSQIETPQISFQVVHNLPNPDYGQFVGREKEILKILEILRPYPQSQEHIVTIDGIGGIGKSALALEVAYYYLRNCDQLQPNERFDAIIWTSAKQNLLTADGIRARAQKLRTLTDVFTVIAATLGREDIIKVTGAEQAQIVRNVLLQQRTLLIIDNLEAVDDETLLTFLRELPPPTKAMVTTRERIDVAFPIRLLGMPWEDASQLINQEAIRKNVELTEQDVSRLFNRTGGIPLAIVWSIAQMGFGYGVDTIITRLGEPSGDIARFCFDTALHNISNRPAYLLLLALSLFATDANRDALGIVTGLSTLDRDDGLVELEKLSLINKLNGRFSLLPLTKEYVSSELGKYPERRKLHQRYFDYYLDLLESLAATEALISSRGENIKSERENILALIKLCQLENPSGAIELISIFAYFLHYFGYWAELIEQCKYGLEKIGNANLSKRARFLSLLGRVDVYQRKIESAKAYLEEAQNLYNELDDKDGYVRATIYLSYALEGLVDRTEAKKLLENSLRIARENNLIDSIARLLNVLAAIEIREEQFESAKNKLEEAILFFESIDPERARGLAPAYRLLARIELNSNNIKAAEQILFQSLRISEATNFTVDLAYSHQQLGRLYESNRNYIKCIEHYSSAVGYFEKLGMSVDSDAMRTDFRRIQLLLNEA